MAPEIEDGLKYDKSVDLYSLGVIVYRLCTFNFPFTTKDVKTLAKKTKGEYE